MNSMAELFYALGDVADGKRTLEEVCRDMSDKNKERFSKFLELGKAFLKDLKSNVKQSVKEEKRKADMEAKYDMSAAVTVDIDGKKLYAGVKPKEKQSWWKKFRRKTSASMKNTAEVVEGSKTVVQGIKDELKRVDKSMSEESKLHRNVSSIVKGTIRGTKDTFRNLRGISGAGAQPQKPKISYETLEPEQFSVAMGVAYENIVHMEHFGRTMPDAERAKGLAEVQKVIDAAKKRFPDVKPQNKGAYFQNAQVQSVEAELFAYMKADAAKSGDSLMQREVANYEAWRDGKDSEIKGPMMTLKEEPFSNIARYGSASWRNGKESAEWTAETMLKDPLKSGRNVMTKKEVAAMQAKMSKIKVH